MKYSTTIVAVAVQLLVVILPMFGVTLGEESLTNMVQSLTVIVAGLWVWYRRVSVGDVSILGAKR